VGLFSVRTFFFFFSSPKLQNPSYRKVQYKPWDWWKGQLKFITTLAAETVVECFSVKVSEVEKALANGIAPAKRNVAESQREMGFSKASEEKLKFARALDHQAVEAKRAPPPDVSSNSSSGGDGCGGSGGSGTAIFAKRSSWPWHAPHPRAQHPGDNYFILSCVLHVASTPRFSEQNLFLQNSIPDLIFSVDVVHTVPSLRVRVLLRPSFFNFSSLKSLYSACVRLSIPDSRCARPAITTLLMLFCDTRARHSR
jgi:hypothetical protein